MKQSAYLGFAVTFGLSACVTSDPSNSANLTRYINAETLVENMAVLPGTRFDAMPATGSGNFVGYGFMTISPSTRIKDDIELLGDVTMHVDFTAGSVTGAITNFEGALVTQSALAGDKTFNVDGQINIGDHESYIGGDLPPNAFYTTYNGTLKAPDDTYAVPTNGIFGRFTGTRVENSNAEVPMKGLVAYDDEGIATNLAGENVGVVLIIGAENPLD